MTELYTNYPELINDYTKLLNDHANTRGQIAELYALWNVEVNRWVNIEQLRHENKDHPLVKINDLITKMFLLGE